MAGSTLTDQIAGLGQRVSALEGSNTADNAGIARIFKIYGNIKVSVKTSVYLHKFAVCDAALYGEINGNDLYL